MRDYGEEPDGKALVCSRQRARQFPLRPYTPPGFIAPSMGWNWRKYDYGVRFGIVRGLDLTAEYARNDAILRRSIIHPDEWLVTTRVAF
jgi:hypothetical protein